MSVQNIRESFVGLLSSLVSENIITEEAKSQYVASLDNKINESNEQAQEQLSAEFNKAIEDAAKKLCEEFQSKVKLLEQDVKEVTDEPAPEEGSNQTEISIADAFKKFLDCLKEENFKAFNELTDSFTDEQKEMFQKFLDGTFGIEEVPEKETEEQENAEGGQEENADQPEEQEAPEESEELTEACAVIGSLGKMFEEAGLSEIFESIISEASPSIASLTKRQEREYERFLKQSIKNLARQNKEMQMTGGVLGGTRRLKNLDEVLAKLRKKLYLSESERTKLEEQLAQSSNEICESKVKINTLSEQLKDAKGDNAKLIEESTKLKENEKLLTEAVESAKKEASINEAKAYLTESVKDFSADLKLYLKKQFDGQGIEVVKKGLNEAVEAYRNERREERQQLRKNSVVSMSRTVNEAVVEKQVDTEEDQFVAGITAFSNSIVKH